MLLQTFEDLEPLLRTVLVGLRYNAEILQEQNKVYYLGKVCILLQNLSTSNNFFTISIMLF